MSDSHKISTIVLAAIIMLCAARMEAQDSDTPPDPFSSWILPSPQVQLYAEGLDDRKGLGRIFVPAMTSPATEPYYAVFRGDEILGEVAMGSSFFVMPGDYTVVLGTGTLVQRIRREVSVGREETVSIEPAWGALSVEVLDETRNYYPQDMQIFRADNAESFGIIPAINPELGEQLQTLLLKPGLYKVVRRGEDFNTYVNFTTILIEPAAYTPLTIVVSTTDGNFIGAGVLTSATQLRKRRDWKLYAALHGSFLINSANTASSDDVKNNLSLLGQVDSRAVYDKFPHYYISRNLLEIEALQQEGSRFTISQDLLQFKNTYIYYLLKWVGGYGRLEVTTHLFPTELSLDSRRDVHFMDLDSTVTRVERNTNRVTTAPAFYPLQFKEGMGVNVTPLQSFKTRLSLRAGLGYWQVLNRDAYQKLNDTTFIRIEDNFPQGLETSVLGNFAVLRNLTITTELDLLFPFDQRVRMVMDLENFISLGLTKNVTLEHTLRLQRDPVVDYLIRDQRLSLRFSYFLF